MPKPIPPHPYTVPVDPAGTEHRRWRCVYCKAVGTLGMSGTLSRKRCKADPSKVDTSRDLLDAITRRS